MNPINLPDALAYNVAHGADRGLTGDGPPRVIAVLPELLAELVACWQDTHGLVVDGKWGTQTTASIRSSLAAPLPEPTPVVADHPLGISNSCALAAAETVYYLLGAGGSSHGDAWPSWPWNSQHQCDCSAFVMWAVALHARNDGDWNTAKIVADVAQFNRHTRRVTGRGPETMFVGRAYLTVGTGGNGKPAVFANGTELDPASVVRLISSVRVGDVIVHDGQYDETTGVRTVPGHTGVVTGVHPERFDPAHPELWFRCFDVTHCSAENSRAAGESGHAVAQTDAHPWKSEAMFVTLKASWQADHPGEPEPDLEHEA